MGPQRRALWPVVVSERPGLAARKAATKLLAAIVEARTSLDGLTDPAGGHPQFRGLDGRDQALVRAILMTALRHRNAIAAALAARLGRPLPAGARHLDHILHVAAAQILYLDVPDSAAVDLAVEEASGDPRSRRFAGLANAVLRRLAREKADIGDAPEGPDWFRAALARAWGPARAAAIEAIHGIEAPIDLTVRSEPHLWAGRLGGRVLPTGSVRLVSPEGAIADLPGFAEGAWWVQDAAAALPARLLGDVAGKRVADLCAAPGGKTAQLAAAGARVTAVDISRSRLKRLAANLGRINLEADIVEADLLDWTPPELFDAALLDAPCSSTGTVRRHPDVPWTKTPADVEKLAALQARLLRRAVEFVRPGGRIVFSNCSLLPEEGERLVEKVMVGGLEATPDPIRQGEASGADEFVTSEGFLRTLSDAWPAEPKEASGLDGFFAARFVRVG